MARAKKRKTFRKTIRISGELIQKTFTSAAIANEWYANQLKKKERIEAGLDEPLKPNDISVEDYSKIFMRKRVNGAVVKGTWKQDGQRLEDYIIPLVGNKILRTITTEEWTSVLDQIQKDPIKVVSLRLKKAKTPEEKQFLIKKIKTHHDSHSNTTRNLIRAMLHTLYVYAIEDKVAFTNPIAAVDVLDQGDPEDKIDYWQTASECQRYLAAHLEYAQNINNYSWYCHATWALNAGPRVNELTALRHGDVDLNESRIRISKIYDPYVGEIVDRTKGSRKTKNGGRKRSNRWLYLNEPMKKAYMMLWEATPYKSKDDFIFMNTRDPGNASKRNQSNKLGVSGLTNIHKKMCARAGVKVIRIHDLRHTFGARFVMSGGSLKTLSEILGHSMQWVTERYGHLSESYLAEESMRVQLGAEVNNVLSMSGSRKK